MQTFIEDNSTEEEMEQIVKPNNTLKRFVVAAFVLCMVFVASNGSNIMDRLAVESETLFGHRELTDTFIISDSTTIDDTDVKIGACVYPEGHELYGDGDFCCCVADSECPGEEVCDCDDRRELVEEYEALSSPEQKKEFIERKLQGNGSGCPIC